MSISLHALPSRVITDYYVADTVDEAISFLATHRGKATVIAGGTELLPIIQRGEVRAEHLVDISHIGSLNRIRSENETLTIGAAARLRKVAHHQAIQDHMPALSKVALTMATAPVRHLATIGGNLVSGRGNSDLAVTLLALSAEVEISGLTGEQWLPIASIFVRHGVSRINSACEVLSAVRVHELASGQGLGVRRLPDEPAHLRPKAVAAILVTLQPNAQAYDWVTLSLGVAGDIPRLLSSTADTLSDAKIEDGPQILADSLPDALHDLNLLPENEGERDALLETALSALHTATMRARSDTRVEPA